jgi:cysteine-rich repeat protein
MSCVPDEEVSMNFDRLTKCLGLVALAAALPIAGCSDDAGGSDAGDVPWETDIASGCGNGVLDLGEECDDGILNSDARRDACRNDCRLAFCGDGVADSGESCDDGNDDDGDACRNDCSPATCGDGFLDPGEECDDGTRNSDTRRDACRTNCLRAWCGDGVLDAGESCDDGNRWDGDGCSAICRVEEGCGNGAIEAGEECDDGARNSDTRPGACRTDCRLYHCGDGVRDPDEECDDGNTVEGDGCDRLCLFETPPSCGDGVVGAGEECDDGNDSNEDDCLSNCRIAFCGDGFERTGVEECDTGIEYDGTCTTSCGSAGILACVPLCRFECAVPPETCNGVDDDCDTVPDNGFACRRGTETSCVTTCGSTGTGACTDACSLPPAAACAPPAEVCNGRDDDCDTVPDDGFPCAAGRTVTCRTACLSPGIGACSAACALPTGDACVPPAEVCNGADDDCDTVPDNGFGCVRGTPTTCTTTCGSAGTGACTLDCEAPAGSACAPPAETCNGRDDDCDTVPDDGFPCAAGSTVACTTSCGTPGTTRCSDACEPPPAGTCTPPAEVCNGRDDDCDTVPDNGFACVRGAPTTCTTACGSTGTGTCSDACTAPAGAACAPPAETCNGRDDDCDTLVDDGFPCSAGETRTCIVGSCTGVQTCSASTCDWNPCDFGTAPANDTCAGAIDVSAGGTFVGSTCAAGNTFTATCGGGAASPDVVHRLVLATSADVTLDSVGSDFDAVIHLRSGTTCPGTQLVCDDNSAGGTPGQARIFRNLAAGTYWVVMDGAGAGNRGNYTLNVSVSATPPPVNDACAGAIDITAGGVFSGSTAQAADDHTYSCTPSATGGRDVWYRFTLAQREVVYLDTVDGNTWDSILQIRSGTCAASTAVACADDQCRSYSGSYRSQIVQILDPGTYFVVVDGWNTGAAGNFALRFQHSPCTAATPIAANGRYTGTTTGQGNDSAGACGGATAADAAYYVGLCAPRSVTFSTCDRGTAFDTVVYARAGGCAAGDEVACNDNTSACTVNPLHSTVTAALPQGLSFVVVDGFYSAEGAFALNVSGM